MRDYIKLYVSGYVANYDGPPPFNHTRRYTDYSNKDAQERAALAQTIYDPAAVSVDFFDDVPCYILLNKFYLSRLMRYACFDESAPGPRQDAGTNLIYHMNAALTAEGIDENSSPRKGPTYPWDGKPFQTVLGKGPSGQQRITVALYLALLYNTLLSERQFTIATSVLRLLNQLNANQITADEAMQKVVDLRITTLSV